MEPETPSKLQGQRSPKTPALVFLSFLLVGTVAYFITAPARHERSLRHAPLSRLQDAARDAPNDPRAFYYLGLRLQQAGQGADAASALEHAATLSDSEDVYLAWAAAVPETQANTILTAFLTRHPEDAAGHLALARLFQQANDQSHAYEQAFQATQLDTHDAQIWQTYGDSALATGHFQEAAGAFRHALALGTKSGPDAVHDHIGLGSALMALSRRAEAMTALQDAASLAPGDGAVQAAIGSVLMPDAETPAELEVARTFLQNGLRLRPDLDAVYLPLGECSLKEERWSEAVGELKRAQARAPEDPEAVFALARAYRGLGDIKHAAEATQRHQQLESYATERTSLLLRAGMTLNGGTHLKLARLAVSHGLSRTAVTEYRAALAQTPDDPQIAQELTEARRRAGGK